MENLLYSDIPCWLILRGLTFYSSTNKILVYVVVIEQHTNLKYSHIFINLAMNL